MFIHSLLWARLGDAKIYKAQDPQSCSEACPRITAQSGDSRGGLVDVPVEPGANCDIRKEERFSLRGLRGPGRNVRERNPVSLSLDL